MFFLSESSKNHRVGVDERLIEISDLAITLTHVDFGHPSSSGFRTCEQQNQLFNQGKSRCDGYTLKSKHQSGLALDFYAFADGKASWDETHLTIVAAAFLEAGHRLNYKLEWGGFWQHFKDMPHIQLAC